MFLKGFGFSAIVEGNISHQSPRFEFVGMNGFTVIMFGKTFFQIIRNAGIFLIRVVDAAEEVDVVHDVIGPATPRLRRTPR